eukprot:TRINITY_DN52893_c0_g1_i1.p1 TRINITY_DN52893_c0_g1~~TRINITY_DN52893_c0_g1_i1.p1  ORF type:complete len:207 (-),score=44.68 TRINITY_DN52893_c0_g1_i1:425-1012(-)
MCIRDRTELEALRARCRTQAEDMARLESALSAAGAREVDSGGKLSKAEREVEELSRRCDLLTARERDWAAVASHEAALLDKSQAQARQLGTLRSAWLAEKALLVDRISQLESEPAVDRELPKMAMSQQGPGLTSNQLLQDPGPQVEQDVLGLSDALQRQKQKLQRKLEIAKLQSPLITRNVQGGAFERPGIDQSR